MGCACCGGAGPRWRRSRPPSGPSNPIRRITAWATAEVWGATRDPEVAARTEDYFDTVNVIAIDRHGHLASGVSTSGWAWKYPGRGGDSPIIPLVRP